MESEGDYQAQIDPVRIVACRLLPFFALSVVFFHPLRSAENFDDDELSDGRARGEPSMTVSRLEARKETEALYVDTRNCA